MADIRALVHACVYPSSNEGYTRDQATLTALFKEPEFFLALQELAADKSLSKQERLMASLVTGRELKTKWRSKALVPEGRKPETRQRLFTFLEEEDSAISRPQLGLLVAVARIEYPRTWQNLPQLLLEHLLSCLPHLSSPGTLPPSISTVLINTLWTINALVKDWRTVKVAHGVAVMETFAQAFGEPVGKVLEVWGETERSGSVDWVLGEAGRYSFKILARLCQWHWSRAKGLQSPEGIQKIVHLVQHTVVHAPILQSHRLRLISEHSPDTKLLRSLTKHLRAIGKWWRVMIAIDPKGFCKLEGVTGGIGWWWGEVGGVVAGSDGSVANDDDDSCPYPKRFLLLGLLLFKDILPILAADHPDIFTPDFILSAFHLLVDKLLPLNSTDLEALEEEPEEWLVAENIDEEAWAFEFRPCAERVLIALNNACRNVPRENKVIEPEMLKLLASTETTPPNDLPTVLRRESIYCALGRLSRAMAAYGGVDFPSLLSGIGTWIGQGHPLHRIVKRRVAWLVGEWVSADEECAKLGIVWQVLLHLLGERGESSDAAVRLSAAIAVKECVDLWELPIDYFIPYLEQTVQELLKLLGECNTLDGKRHVNDAIGVVIERVGDKILPYLPTLAQSVPVLWRGATGLEGEWLFKASLVVLTTKLVSAAGVYSKDLMPLVIPLIEESLQPPAKDFFEEDGLILWQTALWNTENPWNPVESPFKVSQEPEKDIPLTRLLPGLMAMVGENMDLLLKLLPLVDSYMMLEPWVVTQHYGELIASTLSKALTISSTNTSSISRLLSTISLWIRCAPMPELAPLLVHTKIWQHVTTALEDDKASGTVLAAYLEILGRVAMRDHYLFLQIVSQAAAAEGRDAEKALEEVLDAIWRNFDYVGETRMRKVVAMGAAALLLTGNTQVLERFDGEFMNIFLDVLGEVQPLDSDPSAREANVRGWRDEHSMSWADIENTAEGYRRGGYEDMDVAYSMPLKQYLREIFEQAPVIGLGPYWEKADEATKRSLEKFLA